MGVDFASHAVTSFIDYLFMKRLAGLLFFVDIQSAFYSCVRPMLYECDGDEDSLALLVLRLVIQPEFVAPFLDTLRAASAITAAHASKHLQQLIASMLTNSWWMLRGHDTPAARQRGFMPGTALAHLAFSLVYTYWVHATPSCR